MTVFSRLCVAFAVLFSCGVASAHFAWIYTNDDSYPRLFFGEGLDDREYHLPEKVAAAEIWQTDIDAPNKALAMAEHEEEGFLGLEAEDPVEPRGRIRSKVVYGNYHGSKLTYYVQNYPAENPETWPAEPDADLDLQAVLSMAGGELKAQVLWRGEPLTGAGVTLSHENAAEGEEGVSAPTDGEGGRDVRGRQARRGPQRTDGHAQRQVGERRARRQALHLRDEHPHRDVPSQARRRPGERPAAVAGGDRELRRGGVRRMAVRLRRPHRPGARPLARQPVGALPPHPARRFERLGGARRRAAAAGAGARGARRQALPCGRARRAQRLGRRGGPALGRLVRRLRPRDRRVEPNSRAAYSANAPQPVPISSR